MFGKRLFERTGKGLKLTDAGRVVFNYARDIFTLGQEMLNTMEHEQAQPHPPARARPEFLANQCPLCTIVPHPRWRLWRC
jgi:DNA-binding transcriptional LysR family regulator